MEQYYIFEDRAEAGDKLGRELSQYNFQDPLILALPRGGVPVAREVALELKAPMDVLVVRKIGAPFNQEYGIGAICEDLHPLFNEEARRAYNSYAEDIEQIVIAEKKELQRRVKCYRGGRALPKIAGRSVILVDDGIATGITAAVAAKFIKTMKAKEVIVASPVCPRETNHMLEKYADQVICLNRPYSFSGVGQWYKDFKQISDDEVMITLREFHPQDSGEVAYV